MDRTLLTLASREDSAWFVEEIYRPRKGESETEMNLLVLGKGE